MSATLSATSGAMFMAELEHHLLTAGHDLAAVAPPVQVDVSKDAESYVTFNGQSQTLKPDDMLMRDGHGVISSVLLGSARVAEHLAAIAANVRIVTPAAVIVSAEVAST